MAKNIKHVDTDAAKIDQFTILTGDRVQLKDLLCHRLNECGWRDNVRALCCKTLQKPGKHNVDKLIAAVTPQARTMVPDEVKQEILLKFKEVLSVHRNNASESGSTDS